MQMLYLKHGQTHAMENLQSIYNSWVMEKKSMETFYEKINEFMQQLSAQSRREESTTKNLLALRQ